MKISEFELGRKKYINLLNRKKKYLQKKQRMHELLKEPLIKEYLEIAVFLSKHTDEEFDEDLLSIKAFDKLAKKTEQSSGIYIYMGEDKITNKVLLADIETLKRFETSSDSFNVLKQNNCIIFIENKNNEPDFYENKLIEVRNNYLCSLKEIDQESAKERIIKRDIIKEI